MECIDRFELEQFLAGKLPAERLMAVDEHVSSCRVCKATLLGLPARAAGVTDLAEAVLSVSECPEYEELSAFVDRTLQADRARTVAAHINACELCSKDISQIRELRSHADLVEKVTVSPRQTLRAPVRAAAYWRHAFAGFALAAAVVAAIMYTHPFGSAPTSRQPIVRAPVVHTPAPRIAVEHHTTPTPTPTPAPTAVAHGPTLPKSTHATVLRDGKYLVIKKDGKLLLARSDGTPVALDADLAASVGGKLTTGRAKPAKPIIVASLPTHLRDEGDYTPPPSAPKLVEPLAKTVLSDRPTLKWSSVALAESYRVSIFAADGTPVASETATSNSMTLARPLTRGKTYLWRVGVKFGESESWAESARGAFRVISADDYASIQRVKSTLPGSHLALGVAYERLGLNAEAAQEYRALRRQNPNSALAREMLHKTL